MAKAAMKSQAATAISNQSLNTTPKYHFNSTSLTSSLHQIIKSHRNYLVIDLGLGSMKVLNPLSFGVLGNAAIGDDIPVGDELFIHTQPHLMFEGKLGYQFGENGIFIGHTHFESDDTTSVSATASEKIWSVLLPPEFNEDASTFAQGNFKGDYNFLDFYFSHHFSHFLSVSIGVSQGSILSRWSVLYRGGDIPGEITLPVNWSNLFSGGGLLLGLHLSYALFSFVHVLGGVVGRAFYGNMTSRLFSADTNGTIIDVNTRFKSLIPEFSANAGFSLNLHLAHPSAYAIVSLLYQYNALFKQDFFVTTAQNRSSGITLNRTIEWAGLLVKITFGFGT